MGDRIPPIPVEGLTDAQQQLLEHVARSRGRIPTPFRIWLHYPELGERLRELGQLLARPTRLSVIQAKLVILTVARHWHADYVFTVHAEEARAAGLSQEVIDALRNGSEPRLSDEVDGLVYEIARSSGAAEAASDDLFSRAVEQLGHDGIAEILAIAGYFSTVALAMKFYRVPPPPGNPIGRP